MKWHLPTSSSHLVRHWYSFIDSPSAFILSLLLCLCICMLFICMMQCWSFALITYCWCVTKMHTSFFSSATLFVSSHPLVLYSALWRPCLVSSRPPLSFLSSPSLYPSLSLSYSQQHHLWRRPVRCLKVALVLFGQTVPTRAVLSQSSKWLHSLSFLEQRSSNTWASSTCSSLERPPHSER